MVLVIDAQSGFYPANRTDVDRAALDDVLRRVAWVVGLAARLDVPIVVTEEDAELHGATAAVICESLPTSTPVLPKWIFGSADNPEILAAIQTTGADVAILVGLETDVCVAHSALGLKDRGMRVVAVHDALYSPGMGHPNGLRRMESSGIELLSAKELMYDWLRTVHATREFFRANPELSDTPGFHR